MEVSTSVASDVCGVVGDDVDNAEGAVEETVGETEGEMEGDTVDERFGGIVGNKIGDVDGVEVDDKFGGTVGDMVGEMVGKAVGNIVGDIVGDKVCGVTGGKVGDIVVISWLVRIVGAKDIITGFSVGDDVGIIVVTDSLVEINIEGASVPAVLLPSVRVAVGAIVGDRIGEVSVGASVL